MTTTPTHHIGTTIHNEAVDVTKTSRGWKLTLDADRLGGWYQEEGDALVAAAKLVPSHRRAMVLPIPYLPLFDGYALRSKAHEIVRVETTDTLVTSFGMTDTLIATVTDAVDRQAIAETRGWILDELQNRGDLHLLGICEKCFGQIGSCECVAVAS